MMMRIDRFFRDAYSKAKETGNPAFECWVFEFDVDRQLRKAKDSTQKLIAQYETWFIHDFFDYVEGDEQNESPLDEACFMEKSGI